MKKKYLPSLLLGLLLVNTACEDIDRNEIYQEEFHKILYLKTSGVVDITLYKTGEDTEYNFSVVKAGAFPELTADVYVEPMTAQELEEYCTPRGLDFQALPSDCYSLSETASHFGPEDRYKIINMALHTTKIEEMPEIESEYVVPVILKSNTDSINSNLNILIIRPEVVVPSVAFAEKGLVSQYCPKGETTIEIPLQLQIDNKWDFTCQVEVAPAAGDYTKLTSGYTLENDGVVTFTKGSSTAILKAKINRTEAGLGEVDMETTVLPLRLKSISYPDFDIDSNELWLGVTSKYPLTANMLYTNAQEPSEGPLANILDGNISTFFHSMWSVSIPDAHYVQVNLPQTIESFKFTYTNRDSNGNAALTNFNVSVSEDGTNFSSLRDFNWEADQLPGIAAGVYNSPLQSPATPVKSIRFTMKGTNWTGGGFFVWSEFSLYGF